MPAQEPKNGFLLKTSEKGDFNQYWYSAHTIDHIVKELQASATKVACLSTPSIYFSIPKLSTLRQNSWVLDFDDQWISDPHFLKYDFNKPQDIPQDLLGAFDCVVIDPPFITREVWEKYAAAAKLLLEPNGKVICSTVAENDKLLYEILGAKPVKFQPSVPNLIYQYNFFLNFEPKVLCEVNSELPSDN